MTARPVRYTLHAGTGGGVGASGRSLPRCSAYRRRCRAVCGDMGGNFGTRNIFYPEYALLPWAARRIGRPVKWTATAANASSATTRAATSP